MIKLYKKILIQGLIILFATSCNIITDPFGPSSIIRTNTCGTDITLPVNLERMSFTPPGVWSGFKPCEYVFTSRDLGEDAWGISVAAYYTYADVVVHDTALGFGVIGNLDMIDGIPITLKNWKESEDQEWERNLENRGNSGNRKVVYETRKNLNCWRETIESLDSNQNQSALSIGYHCWQPGKDNYPPLDIGGWIRYRDGKPIYALDIDKDLIDPVFETLVVKDIKPEVYEERMEIYNKKIEKECGRWLKRVKKNPQREFSAHAIKRLNECGYDTTNLKRKQE